MEDLCSFVFSSHPQKARPSKSTHVKYIILLPTILFLLANGSGGGSVKTLPFDPFHHKLQCNESKLAVGGILCFINSTIIVEVEYYKITYTINFEISQKLGIQFYCYNATPLRVSLPPDIKFPTAVTLVKFNSCRFSTNDNILEILTYSLQLSRSDTVMFDDQLIKSNSLSHTALKGLDTFTNGLSFIITNASALSTDLFANVENLTKLAIYSNSIRSSHLSALLAPLTNLKELVLKSNNLEASKSIFANLINLQALILNWNNITGLSSNFFSNLTSLKRIQLGGDDSPLEPLKDLNLKTLYVETMKLKKSHLEKKRSALRELPDGLLHDMLSVNFELQSIYIDRFQLEFISTEIFNNLRKVKVIYIIESNLHEVPPELFKDQKNLRLLDLSKNMIRKLAKGFFDCIKKVAFLNLSDNRLTNLPNDIFKPLYNLRTLNLDNNNLFTSSPYDNKPQLGFLFDDLKNLSSLSLKNTSITEIPYNIMKSCSKLLYLNLDFNKITSINCDIVLYQSTIILSIKENPIRCECKIMCIYQNLKKRRMGNIPCDFPNNLKGRFLEDLDVSDLLCYPDIHQGNASKRCAFDIRAADSVLFMNCSNRNFKDIPPPPMLDQSFSSGIELYMDNNPLTELSPEILKNNANISLFSISNSSITKLPPQFLANLTKLKTVVLVLPLEDISEDMFLASTEIENMTISCTDIEKLPKKIFNGQQKLKYLDLSRNKLTNMTGSEFHSVHYLKELRLSHNFLKELPFYFINALRGLNILFLDNNLLQYIEGSIFEISFSLQFVSMENNQLTTIAPFVPIFGSLHTLILRNNSIGNDFIMKINHSTPSILDLSLNNINSIDLSELGSINVNKTFFINFTANNIQTIKVKHGNISLVCYSDCKIISFGKQKNKIMTMYESSQCLPPARLKDRQVSNLSKEELLCPMNTIICPKGCQCWIRPINSTLIVNCSSANLTQVPLLPELETTFQNGIELSIEYNQLTSLRPHFISEYKDVTKIYASHNEISNIFSADIPPNITHLDVSYNRIERLDEKVIKVINDSQTLRSVLLFKNPLLCDCSSQNLTQFILRNKRLFPDIDQCADGRKFGTFLYTDFCLTEDSNILTVTLIVVTIILFVLLVLSTWYFKNEEQILVWMYAHNICLRWITEEELDKDKAYDAFVSYSSCDAEFVADLISKLESGPNPYKLCLHDRDWVGGGYIPHQIEQSVECSKRTIAVMTQNYMKSQWARLELRTAHNASMNEKRSRVIVIIVGDVNIEHLDSDVRKYVKMYTYLKWGDPWFWERLSYALPHRSKKNEPNKQLKRKMIRNGDGSSGKRHPFYDETLF